jgi:hypothetical protein
VRSLVLEPFFSAWEPASILAYLRDPDQFVDDRDMLSEAGGKYLERREIMNIFAQNMKKAYPGLEISDVKKEQEKYKAVKMCNFKGCNLAFPDHKALTAHRKLAHVEKRHDHSEKLYTCPNRQCHRRKKSKGFVSMAGLKEHQIRMHHWGTGDYLGDDGPRDCEPVLQADYPTDVAEGENHTIMSPTLPQLQLQPRHPLALPLPHSHIQPSHLQQNHLQHHQPQLISQLPNPEIPLLPLLHSPRAQMSQPPDRHLLHIDPAMQPTPQPQQQQQQGQAHQIHPALQSGGLVQQQQQQQSGLANDIVTVQQRQAMLDRYNALQQEMEALRGALFTG